MRLVRPGEKTSAKVTYTVFAVSAIWHGFYPSYYIMFFNAGCIAEISKDIYRSKVLFDFIPEDFRGIVANVASFLAMNYLGVAFNLLVYDKLKYFMLGTYGYIFILLPTFLVVSRSLGMVKIAKKREEQLKIKAMNKVEVPKESKKEK